MDISEQCIKMCEKAWEIQAMRGDGLWSEGDFKVFITAGLSKIDDPPKPELPYYIWLPRQDQLQEMVNKSLNLLIRDFEIFHGGIWRNGNTIDTNEVVRNEKYILQFTSMEQLWLAFVMKEKYGKAWNGEDWVQGL